MLRKASHKASSNQREFQDKAGNERGGNRGLVTGGGNSSQKKFKPTKLEPEKFGVFS